MFNSLREEDEDENFHEIVARDLILGTDWIDILIEMLLDDDIEQYNKAKQILDELPNIIELIDEGNITFETV